MNYLQLTRANGQKIKFKVASHWNECTFLQFVQSREHIKNRLKIYEIFTGINADIWNEPHDPALFLALDAQLNFISEEPATTLPDIIQRKGEFYDVPKNLLKVPYGKYSDFLTLYRVAGAEPLEILKIVPQLVGVFACLDYETEEELAEIGKEVEQMPADEVNTLATFFFQKLTESRHGKTNFHKKKNKTRLIFIAALIYFLVVTGTVLLYFSSPTKILPRLREYILIQWKRSILGYKLIQNLDTVRKSTER